MSSRARRKAWTRIPPARLDGDPRSARRRPARPWGNGIRLAAFILKPLLLFWTRPTWVGLQRVPRQGPVILACNHISAADPVTLADLCVYGLGRVPSYLAKSSLFTVFFVGWVLRIARQIPVYREQSAGGGALDAAREALGQGACVVIYPEGTVTRDPEGWPMTGRTGVARLALETGAPVFPVAQWGAAALEPADGITRWLPRPRTPVAALVGPEIDLSRWRGSPLSAQVLDEATQMVMTSITAAVEQVRGQRRPDRPVFDLRLAA